MLIYCTKCWQENPATNRKCLRCGASLETNSASYLVKLIRALGHPEPQTVQRAAWILGELGDHAAVEPLIALLQNSSEMGALESCTEALGKIGDKRAVNILFSLVTSSYLPVRLIAVDALKKIGTPSALAALTKASTDTSGVVSSYAKQALRSFNPEL